MTLIQFTPNGISKLRYIIPFLTADLYTHKPKVYTIGRDPTCSIKLNDISISRMQTSIVFHNKSVYIMDGGCDFNFNLINQVELDN